MTVDMADQPAVNMTDVSEPTLTRHEYSPPGRKFPCGSK